MSKKVLCIPSVLSSERKIALSSGLFYATNYDNQEQEEKLYLMTKTVRGTMSHRIDCSDDAKSSKDIKDPKNSNPQTVDYCELPDGYDSFKLKYTVKFLSNIENFSSCSNELFNQRYKKFIKMYNESLGYDELSKRYLINILNGRTLWRNRLGADEIDVNIKIDDKELKVSAYDFSLNYFDYMKYDDKDKFNEIVKIISDTFSGKRTHSLMKVEIVCKIGNGQEVFPSEEFVNKKTDKSKVLYSVNGQAGMHSQKISNAIRTIDTWYNDYEENDRKPISVENYGQVTVFSEVHRGDKNTNFYALFDNIIMNDELSKNFIDVKNPDNALDLKDLKYIKEFKTDEEIKQIENLFYVIALLIRGGVFSSKKDKDKDKDKDKNKDKNKNNEEKSNDDKSEKEEALIVEDKEDKKEES